MNRDEALEFLRGPDSVVENPDKILEAIQVINATAPGPSNTSSEEGEKSEDPCGLMVNSYKGAIEFLFEIGTWLTLMDNNATSTRDIIESVVMETIFQNYDKAKSVEFVKKNAVGNTMQWLGALLESPRWRQTMYKLAAESENEDCPLLSLAMACISVNEHLVGELVSVPMAWNTLQIFLKCASFVLKPLLAHFDEILSDDLVIRTTSLLQPGGAKGLMGRFARVPTLADTLAPLMAGEGEEKEGAAVSAIVSGGSTALASGSTASAAATAAAEAKERRQDYVFNPYLLHFESMTPLAKTTYEFLVKFLEMGCHSEQTYLMLQSVLQCLIRKSPNSDNSNHDDEDEEETDGDDENDADDDDDEEESSTTPELLSWLLECEARARGRDVSRYSVYFCFSRNYPEAMAAMRAILHAEELDQDNVNILYSAYKSEAPPPAKLIRHPVFLVLLADALFASPDRLLAERQETYSYLYAHASVAKEKFDYETERRLSLDRSEIAETHSMVLKASRICKHWNEVTCSTVTVQTFWRLKELLEYIAACRPVSYGVFRFISYIFRDKRVQFELNMNILQPYCVVVDDLIKENPYLRPGVLTLLAELLGSNVEGGEDLSQLDYKKMLVTSLVHLCALGYGIATTRTMQSLFERNRVDVSIARHFVTVLLSVAEPPFDKEFMTCFYPLVTHPHILEGINNEKHLELVERFQEHYRKMEEEGEEETGSDSA